MVFSKQQIKVLGLKNNEVKILEALNVSLNITELAEATKLPRTSLNFMLLKLKKRGFVESHDVGKRKRWQRLGDEKLEQLMKSLYVSNTTTKDVHEKLYLKKSENTELVIYRGMKNLIHMYKRMIELHKYERLYFIQPNQAADLVLKKFPFKDLIEINKTILKNKIIVEAILHDNAIPFYIEALKRHKKTHGEVQEIFQSFNGRLADTTYVPKEFLDFNAEVVMMGDTVFLLNWKEEVAAEIKNQDIVGIFRKMFEAIKMYGSKVDQNPVIDKLIQSISI